MGIPRIDVDLMTLNRHLVFVIGLPAIHYLFSYLEFVPFVLFSVAEIAHQASYEAQIIINKLLKHARICIAY